MDDPSRSPVKRHQRKGKESDVLDFALPSPALTPGSPKRDSSPPGPSSPAAPPAPPWAEVYRTWLATEEGKKYISQIFFSDIHAPANQPARGGPVRPVQVLNPRTPAIALQPGVKWTPSTQQRASAEQLQQFDIAREERARKREQAKLLQKGKEEIEKEKIDEISKKLQRTSLGNEALNKTDPISGVTTTAVARVQTVIEHAKKAEMGRAVAADEPKSTLLQRVSVATQKSMETMSAATQKSMETMSGWVQKGHGRWIQNKREQTIGDLRSPSSSLGESSEQQRTRSPPHARESESVVRSGWDNLYNFSITYAFVKENNKESGRAGNTLSYAQIRSAENEKDVAESQSILYLLVDKSNATLTMLQTAVGQAVDGLHTLPNFNVGATVIQNTKNAWHLGQHNLGYLVGMMLANNPPPDEDPMNLGIDAQVQNLTDAVGKAQMLVKSDGGPPPPPPPSGSTIHDEEWFKHLVLRIHADTQERGGGDPGGGGGGDGDPKKKKETRDQGHQTDEGDIRHALAQPRWLGFDASTQTSVAQESIGMQTETELPEVNMPTTIQMPITINVSQSEPQTLTSTPCRYPDQPTDVAPTDTIQNDEATGLPDEEDESYELHIGDEFYQIKRRLVDLWLQLQELDPANWPLEELVKPDPGENLAGMMQAILDADSARSRTQQSSRQIATAERNLQAYEQAVNKAANSSDDEFFDTKEITDAVGSETLNDAVVMTKGGSVPPILTPSMENTRLASYAEAVMLNTIAQRIYQEMLLNPERKRRRHKWKRKKRVELW